MKQLSYTLSVLALSLVGCSPPASETVPAPVARVTTAPATRGDLPETVTGFGTVEFHPAGQRTLNAEIEARVLGVHALPGDSLEQDQIVLQLAPSSAAGTELTRARRDATTAQAAADRATRLRADGLASDGDVEAAANAARDQVALADSLEASAGALQTMLSPINGIMDALFVEPGDLVAPGTMMARLASPGAIQARIGIEIEDASRLVIGDRVILMPLNETGAPVDAVIGVVDSRVDPATRMASAVVTIPPGQGFHAGEAVRARIIIDIKSGVVIAPRQSVFTDETGAYVFVAESGIAVLKRVETGLINSDKTEIVSGIASGDELIVDGAAILSDGMKIMIDQPVGTAAGGAQQ